MHTKNFLTVGWPTANFTRGAPFMRCIFVTVLTGLVAVIGFITLAAQDAPSANAGLTILSDTHGYDFAPYLNDALKRIRSNWYTLVPEVARLGKQGRVVVVFNIELDGKVSDLRVTTSSESEPLDRAALGAVVTSNPFMKLPSGFDGERLTLQMVFLYNLRQE
jgi:TonB family protein